MLNIKVPSASVEENFVFGSPPLLNGFVYNSCRSETRLNPHHVVNHESFNNYNNFVYDAPQDPSIDHLHYPSTMAVSPSAHTTEMKRKPFLQQQKFPVIPYSNRNYYSSSHQQKQQQHHHQQQQQQQQQQHQQQPQQQQQKNGFRIPGGESVAENLSQMNISSHVDKGIKMLEHQVGYKVNPAPQTPSPISSPETTFKKRKDLRVLKLALSNERFREVSLKFGDGDEGGREISESVHRTLRRANTSHVACLHCRTECQVYENFPIVDGTLFLTPVPRSPQCVRFISNEPSPTTTTTSKAERYLGFVCVSCMEGRKVTCSGCNVAWNGSFFQVGTMYSYDILSATPCCVRAVSCNKCARPVIDLSKGEAHNLFFSNFSARTTCPHCGEEDFHFIKPLSSPRVSQQSS